jgi:alkanesulfonate monooxygenase SsuD/methylene tetrahydromethanopterin reductase-like flavin-dependent oxidoreductase (luciferase family)
MSRAREAADRLLEALERQRSIIGVPQEVAQAMAEYSDAARLDDLEEEEFDQLRALIDGR